MTNKPLTEIQYTEHLFNSAYALHKSIDLKETMAVFPAELVESVVQLLKEKLSRSSLINDDCNEVYDLIDECFPIFAEKKEE